MQLKLVKRSPIYRDVRQVALLPLSFSEKQVHLIPLLFEATGQCFSPVEAADLLEEILYEENFLTRFYDYIVSGISRFFSPALSALKRLGPKSLLKDVEKKLPEFEKKAAEIRDSLPDNERMKQPDIHDVRELIRRLTERMPPVPDEAREQIRQKLSEHMRDDQWNPGVWIYQWVLLYVIYTLLVTGTAFASLGMGAWYLFLVAMATDLMHNLASKEMTV